MADSRVSRSSAGLHPIDFVRDAARNSPWILIAVALHLVLIAAAAVFYTARHDGPRLENDLVVKVRDTPRAEEVPLPIETPVSRDAPPNEERQLVAFDENVYIPDSAPVDPALDPGDPEGDIEGGPIAGNTSIGVGKAGIRGHPPTSLRDPGGTKRIRKTGGGDQGPNEDTEEAVLEGLRWLARHQNEDGSWSPATLVEACPCDHPAYNPKRPYGREFDTGLTGLALLAYLGAGYSHESKQFLIDRTTGKRHTIGVIVKKGLQWLTRAQNQDGSFTPTRPFLYNEALATMALSEAYGLTQHRFWREPAQRALDYLQAAQRPSPTGTGLWGWRYASRQEVEQFHRGAGSLDAAAQKDLFDADTSVTGWCVMALKSGQLSGLEVRDGALAGGVAFAGHVIQLGGDGKPTGLAGYLDAKGAGSKVTGPNDQFEYHPGSMSALAMCIRIFGQRDPDDPFLRPAAEQIVKDLPRVSPDGLSVDYYYWYYASLALNQVDGPDAPKRSGRYWPAWNKAMVDAVLGLQDRTKGACTSGGWLAPDRWSLDHGGPLYATALNVLTLEVYYRYANAFGGRRRH